MSNDIFRSSILTIATIAAGLSSAWAADTSTDQSDSNKLMIVSRNTGRIVYDDGRNDLFCVTRRYVAGYDDDGYAIHRRSMRCR